MEDNVVNFQRHLEARGRPPSRPSGAAVPAEPPPTTTNEPPLQANPPEVTGAGGTEVVPAHRRPARPPRLPRPPRLSRRRRSTSGGDRAAALVRRHERRVRLRYRLSTGCRWILTRLWWIARGCAFTLRGFWRAVWQPDDAAWIREIRATDPAKARAERRKLRAERRAAVAAILIVTAGAWITLDWRGQELAAWIPTWFYWLAGALVALGLLFTGRPEPRPADEDQAQGMPASLTLDASDRGVARTVREGLHHIKSRGDVHDVTREPGGWGWTVTLAVLDDITEARLAALERYLNTPRGGLVLSPVTQAARVRRLRIVMADLLATPTDAPARAQSSVRTPIDLATRFDGGRLTLELFGRHMLIVGRTGSGKSGVLHDVVDALTSMTDVTVDGLDISAGPDLRAWEPALRAYVGGPDFVAAEELLLGVENLVKDRTARLGARYWDTTADGVAHVLVIDEYGLVAEHPRLRAHVEYVITYGAKVGVWVVLAAQRKVKDMLGSQLIVSQVHLKVYLGMAAEDVAGIPKSEREQGVRPYLFQPSTRTDPHDAGKAFVVGVEPMPLLVRFDRLDRAPAATRADERAEHQPALGERDLAVLTPTADDGVPELLLLVRDAIMATASAAHRRPERASSEEIVAYLARAGRLLDKAALVGELRTATGGLINRSRDTNLASGSNPKGLYLDDVDGAIRALRDRDRGDVGG